MPSVSYSGTPLGKKLGFKPGMELLVVNEPQHCRKLVEPLPDNVKWAARLSATTDLVHLFVTRKVQLAEALRTFRAKINTDCVIWVSWPKKAAKVPSDLTDNAVRETALPLGLVDIKVCAIDDVWSGLKFVVRKELR
jgi:hypothetical protein